MPKGYVDFTQKRLTFRASRLEPFLPDTKPTLALRVNEKLIIYLNKEQVLDLREELGVDLSDNSDK